MKCQACDKPATVHVTEVVGGSPVEYHVCADHVPTLDALEPRAASPEAAMAGLMEFWTDPQLRGAVYDQCSREKLAAHLLPALCLALLDQKPEVRVAAAYHLMCFGSDAESARGSLRDATEDSDERVRKAARIGLRFLESGRKPPWLKM